MVLVDTSVWIRFLAGKYPYLGELRELLYRRKVVGHDLVFGELLIGDKGGRKVSLSEYSDLSWLPTVPHPEVVAFVYSRQLHGRGAGWIDVHLLASALVGGVKFWTADHALFLLAEDLGIAYLPSPTRRPPH